MNNIEITFNNQFKKSFKRPLYVKDLIEYYIDYTNEKIMGISIDNTVKKANEEITKNSNVFCITKNNVYGNKMYQAALKFVLYVASLELWGKETKVYFCNSIDKGIYIKIIKKEKFTKDDSVKLKKKMQEIIDENLPFERLIIEKKQAIKYFLNYGEDEKCKNIKNLASNTVTLFKLKNYYNYFYTELPHNTKVLTSFDIEYRLSNIILIYPTISSNDKLPEYHHFKKTLDSFENYRNWLHKLNVSYVSDLNYLVQTNNIKEFVMCNEMMALQNIADAAKEIIKKNAKIVLISGPTSSGKTTSAKRLSLMLKTYGIKVKSLSTDDYFKERLETKKDKDGDYEFENLEAIDLDLFQKDMEELINGFEIYPPTFNFKTGKKEFNKKSMKLSENEIIIIEGLHCLNDKLLKNIDENLKFKIYVSPFIGLNIDRHNHLSTIDLRLIRLIVRDNEYRSIDVNETLRRWNKIKLAEEKNIYLYQEKADFIINTALAYELGVLKVFAEPLLQSVDITSLFYEEANRLISFLRSFCPITKEIVPNFSVLREFIGNSVFND